jgi:hypothetical protein
VGLVEGKEPGKLAVAVSYSAWDGCPVVSWIGCCSTPAIRRATRRTTIRTTARRATQMAMMASRSITRG